MTCTAILGRPRTGKTLYMTMIARADYELHRKIFSNYDLYGFPYTKYSLDDLLSIATMEMEISPKTVVMQEASKWFDARRSSRKENTLLTSFTGQSGKREIDIYYDDQFITRIDRGLRDITDFSYVANCIRDPKTKTPLVFEYELYNGYFLSPTGKTVRIPAFYMQQFYDMYNTRQPTKAFEGKTSIDRMMEQDNRYAYIQGNE